jgi:dTDP-4-dehydrorhamnose reductase
LKIAVIGSTGQLGSDLYKTLQEKHEIIGLTHADLEVTDLASCDILKKQEPEVIINTAAFHKTDQCEEEPLKAFQVNAIGALNIARTAAEIDATAVYISTDYVFDGKAINTYGISKLAGEFHTRQNQKHYVMRVASLFGVAGSSGKGGNFVETMIAKARKNEPISVVDDMWMSPTYTKHASVAITKIIAQKLGFGTYHVSNQGSCSWFQFAQEIFKILGSNPNLTPIKTNQLQYKAKRPRFSALRSMKLAGTGIQTPHWKKSVNDYLVEKGYIEESVRM